MRELNVCNDGSNTFTYQTRIKEEASELADFLQEYATLYSKVERKLYAAYASGKNIMALKSDYLIRYGLTARQFNSLRISLQGKIDSICALQGDYIADLKARIKKVIVDIKKLQGKERKTPKQGNKLHQKQRLLVSLNLKLKRLEQDKQSKRVRICFGSKRLFKQQFNLLANNLDNHQEWKTKWQKARSSQFYVIGSKDETMGNQSCITTINEDGSFNLKIRVPDALIPKYGKFININNLIFQYGQAEITAAISNNITRNIYARKAQQTLKPGLYKNYGLAINYRFLKDDKGWRVFVTCAKQSTPFISDHKLGVIGVDINVDHLAVTEIDRHGNLQTAFKVSTCTYGKNTNQAKAIIGDAVKQIVAFAVAKGKPIVIEKLDFAKRKQELSFNTNKKYNRQISSFSYKAIINNIKCKAFKHAIAVYQVNPAYTSVIGRIKFARIYKISIHQAAAMAIARRILGFSERLPHHWDNIPDDTGGRVTLPALVKIQGKHVWHSWAVVRKNLQAVLVAQFQRSRQVFNPHVLAGELAF